MNDLQTSTGISNPLTLLQSMIDKGADPSTLKQMMDLANDWKRARAAEEFAQDMSACQAEMPAVVRSAFNSHTQSNYAPFEAINALVKPICGKHGFSLSFTEEPCQTQGAIRMVLEVSHGGGHTKKVTSDFPLDGVGIKGAAMMTAIQAKVSTISYARRALLKMAFNIAEANEDQDGNQVSGLVSDEEVKQLAELIKEKSVDYSRFLKWAECDSLANMPKERFAKALDFLKRKEKPKTNGTPKHDPQFGPEVPA